MHINIKNRIYNSCNNMIESEKLETENSLIDKKNYIDLAI